MELLTPFVALVPLQYIVVILLSMGLTHILKIILGNAIQCLHKDVQTWRSFSVLVSLLSGGLIGTMATIEFPKLFVASPTVMGGFFAILVPLVASLLMHSDRKIFQGLKTDIDRKFCEQIINKNTKLK